MRRKCKRRQWTTEEDALVLERSMTDRELGEIIERSVEAIQARRSKLKAKEYSERRREIYQRLKERWRERNDKRRANKTNKAFEV